MAKAKPPAEEPKMEDTQEFDMGWPPEEVAEFHDPPAPSKD
jgi:hypothetical protein